MPGEGFILNMINSMKDNRRLLKNKRPMFNMDRSESHEGIRKVKLIRRRIPKEKVERVKTQIRLKYHRENIRDVILFITLFLIFAGILYYLFFI